MFVYQRVESKSFDFRNFAEYFSDLMGWSISAQMWMQWSSGPSWIEDFVVWHPRRTLSADDHKWSTRYPKQPFFNGCLVKQPFFYVMIWNHPVETTIKNWLFGVPGNNFASFSCHISFPSRFLGARSWDSLVSRIVRFRSFKAFFWGVTFVSNTYFYLCC